MSKFLGDVKVRWKAIILGALFVTIKSNILCCKILIDINAMIIENIEVDNYQY